MKTPTSQPKENRLTILGVLFFTVAIAAYLGIWKSFSRYETPPTMTDRWLSADGGYIQFATNNEVLTYLLISKLPHDQVSVTEASLTGIGTTRSFLKVVHASDSRNISISTQPTIILVDVDGEVHAGACPVDRAEFEQLIESLYAAPVDPKSGYRETVQLTKDFVNSYSSRNWPHEVREVLLEE